MRRFSDYAIAATSLAAGIFLVRGQKHAAVAAIGATLAETALTVARDHPGGMFRAPGYPRNVKIGMLASMALAAVPVIAASAHDLDKGFFPAPPAPKPRPRRLTAP